MKNWRRYLPHILLFILIVFTVVVCFLVYSHAVHSNMLKVAFLNIGQGDAIYIEAPNGKQMLVDSGPGPIILSKLAKVMSFADRSIDVVLATHTDADHIGGFPFVFENYKIGKIIKNEVTGDTKTYNSLENEVMKHNVDEVIARRGMRIVLDNERNIYFDILFPDRDVSTTSFTSNDGSIVGKLVYGNESFMLTGDATKYTENLILHNETESTLRSTVLKLGHHGSRYSSSELWLEKVHPQVAIVSAGFHNPYGHPHKEVLDLLSKLSIPYLATYDKGTIVFKTDGVKLYN